MQRTAPRQLRPRWCSRAARCATRGLSIPARVAEAHGFGLQGRVFHSPAVQLRCRPSTRQPGPAPRAPGEEQPAAPSPGARAAAALARVLKLPRRARCALAPQRRGGAEARASERASPAGERSRNVRPKRGAVQASQGGRNTSVQLPAATGAQRSRSQPFLEE